MWTDDAREKYRMVGHAYPSSMRDGEWAVVAPNFPSPAATAAYGLMVIAHVPCVSVRLIFYSWRGVAADNVLILLDPSA